MVRVLFPATGPQLFVFGQRIHHWLSGLAFVALGLLLVWHDRKDIGRWS